MKKHYIEEILRDPTNPVGVLVVGAGGTGSQVLTHLARMDRGLTALGHPGLHIVACDDDRVSDANIGRQIFGEGDIGRLKAATLVTRINRYFGTDWESIPRRFEKDSGKDILSTAHNLVRFVVTCVDSGQARRAVGQVLDGIKDTVWSKPVYWLDFGNSRDSGQYILGTTRNVEQPKDEKDAVECLPTILELCPDIEAQDEPDVPSCSLREALLVQDLFINSVLAGHGINLLWRMFTKPFVENHGGYVNLASGITAPIKVQEKEADNVRV